jgi:hypothetical protein
MLKILIIISFFNFSYLTYSNDGAFYAQGNNLIPIEENEISLIKEILTIKKIDKDLIELTVYYELFNPHQEKTLIVGFEALSPSGDVEAAPINGKHPYINDFTVEVNDIILPYEIAHVRDSAYYKKDQINSIDLESFKGSKEGNEVDFDYVYHFKTNFKKGKNIIKHTYNYKAGSFIGYNYQISYKLTTALRWANKQIDDFTLIIDVGEFESISVDKTFFSNCTDWLLNGIGKCVEIPNKSYDLFVNNYIEFHIQNGFLIFNKKDFSPSGELLIFSLSAWIFNDFNKLPFSYNETEQIKEPENEFQIKVLKNLPFARRGYVFKNKDLYDFYSKVDWYIPNPSYIPILENLTIIEKQWLKNFK